MMIAENSLATTEVIPVETPQMSRRGFLKGLAAAGAVVATSGVVVGAIETLVAEPANAQGEPSDQGTPQAGQPSVEPAESLGDRVQDTLDTKTSHLDTALQTLPITALNTGISLVSHKMGVATGNSKYHDHKPVTVAEKLEKENKLREVAYMPRSAVLAGIPGMVVITPAVEETIFRLLPSKVLNLIGVSGNAWPVGLADAIWFAGVHRKNEESGIKTIPVQQFNLGLWTWWLQRNRGFSHALTAHSTNNAVAAAWIMGSYEKTRAKYR